MSFLDDAADAGRALRADLRVVAAQFGRQDIFFHAGSVAYSALLAGVPFLLLLASAIGYAIGKAPAASNEMLARFVRELLPDQSATAAMDVLTNVLSDAERRRASLGLLGAPLFAWFSTRFFGALRTSLGTVFDVKEGRGLFRGKLYDMGYVFAGTILVTAYIAISVYLSGLGTEFGTSFLRAIGFRTTAVGFLEFFFDRLMATAFLAMMFASLYKFLPNRSVPWESAAWGGVWCAALFEITKTVLFTLVGRSMNPASLYTGTLAAIVVVVFWAYYASVIFLVGGVVARVHEVRGSRRGAVA